jgi:rRNA maturation RNase YbeY
MNIVVCNHQTQMEVSQTAVGRLASFLTQRIDQERVQWEEISVVLCDDNTIRRINRRFLGRDDVTDVIAFKYAQVPGESHGALHGEVIVNVEEALRHAADSVGLQREIALYVAHGCDHLRGGDDSTPAGRRLMRARELRWLRLAQRRGCIPVMLTPRSNRQRRPPTRRRTK